MRGVTCLLGLLHVSLAFNLEVRYPHVYHSDTPHDYFGFSVALHPGSGDRCDVPWMLVGAPRSNRSDVPNVRQPGRVLQCRLGEPCVPLYLDTGRGEHSRLDDGMLGSVQDMHSGKFVSCAPRWSDTVSPVRYHILGECFWGSSAGPNNATRISPLRKDKGGNLTLKIPSANNKTSTQPYFAYGEAGFSAHFPNVQKPEEMMVLGAPGIFNWQGSTVIYRNKKFKKEPIVPNPFESPAIKNFGYFGYAVSSGRFFQTTQLLHVAGAPRSDYFGQVFVYDFPEISHKKITLNRTLNGKQAGEYFGSSLAVGNFNGDNLDDLVVGAPLYSDDQDEGRVFVYYGNSTGFSTPIELKGEKPNGRFGTSISCVGDLDHDGFQDLAISAPYEGHGVVYIYNGEPGGVSAQHSQRIEGSVVAPGSRGFGFSLSRGQDVDANGYDDVAVGAYKSGHAVLLRARPVVKLSARLYPILPDGSKLARNSTHLDINLCASYEGHLAPEQIEVVRRLEVDKWYRRVVLGANQNHSVITLYSKSQLADGCQVIRMNVKQNIENFNEIIPIKVEYQLVEEKDEYNALELSIDSTLQEQAVTNKSCRQRRKLAPLSHTTKETKQTVANAEVLFETECGDDNICDCDLSVSLQFVDPQSVPISSFVVGSDNSLRVLLNVTNSAGRDPAYLTRVQVFLPSRTMRSPASCNELPIGNISRNAVMQLECVFEKPLSSGQTRELEFQLDVADVSTSQTELRLVAVALTSSQDQNPDNNEASATLGLTAEAGVAVSGSPENELYTFNDKDDEDGPAKKNISFRMRYRIEKFGTSGVDEVSLIVKFPHSLRSGKQFLQLSEPEILLNSQPMLCLSDVSDSGALHGGRQKREAPDQVVYHPNRTLYVNCKDDSQWGCKQVQCVVGPFLNNRVLATLQLDMQLDVTLLEPLLGFRDIILYGTVVEAKITKPQNVIRPANSKKVSRAEVSARFLGRIPAGRVDTWVLTLSVTGGVLLLLMLINGLVKAGFFERTQKDALLKLKRETMLGPSAMFLAPMPGYSDHGE